MTNEEFKDSVKEFEIVASHRNYAIEQPSIMHLMDFMSIKEYKKTRVIVTGSEGFIGKRLCAKLRQMPDVLLVECDRKNGTEAYEMLDIIKRGTIDVVYHLAAQTSVFNTDVSQIRKDNIDLFINLARACAKSNTKLVYASSSTANHCNTTSLYGLSKRFDEDFARIYCPSATGVRLHNVWSEEPREGTLMWCLLNKPHTVLYNNGMNERCFTYVDDAVNALIWASTSDEQLVNAVNYEPMQIKRFAELIKKYVPSVSYSVSNEKRNMDNPQQLVDFDLPFAPMPQETKVEQWLSKIYNNSGNNETNG